MFGPVLKGAKVTLRPPDGTDAQRFIDWFADTDVTRYLGTAFPLSLEGEEEAIKTLGGSKNDVFWVIEAEGRAIGGIGIHRIDWVNAHGTTGTMIGDKSMWRKGYGSEAMSLRTGFAFRQLNLHKLNTEVFADNEASRRALQKAGYTQTGIRHEEFWRDGRWHDHWLAEILRADWEKHQARR